MMALDYSHLTGKRASLARMQKQEPDTDDELLRLKHDLSQKLARAKEWLGTGWILHPKYRFTTKHSFLAEVRDCGLDRGLHG